MDVWPEVRAEREDLLAFVEGLTQEQWDAPSLCTEWRVRDVVAHVTMSSAPPSRARFAAGLVRSGFDVNRVLGATARERGAWPPERIRETLRSVTASHRRPPFTSPPDMLLDALVHNQDIRRPLGLPREIPEGRLRMALDHAKSKGWPLNARRRVSGLRLRASDVDWVHGDGPEVKGPGEALVMAMVGRPAALADLRGDGAPTLASRF